MKEHERYSIRLYLPDDFKQVYYVLKSTHTLDELNSELIHEKLDDCQEDLNRKWVAVDQNDQIVGFIQCVCRKLSGKSVAFIKMMGVLSEFQKQGIGKALLEVAETFALSHECSDLRFYDSPKNYLSPGIDPFYTNAIVFVERNGFIKFGDTSNLMCSLRQNWDTAENETELEKQHCTFKRADDSDLPVLLAWIQKEFPLWETELTRSLNKSPKAVHIAYQNGSLIAFAAHSGNNAGLAWFGPMGTSPDARGKGVGAVLLKRCLSDLRKAGFEKAIIPWVGPIPFYAKHANATLFRIFWRYQKTLMVK